MEITQEHGSRHSEQEFTNRFGMLADSGAGLIHVRAHETMRTVLAIRKAVVVDGGAYKEWDIVNGFRAYDRDTLHRHANEGDNMVDPSAAFSEPLAHLRRVDTTNAPQSTHYYVFINPQQFIENNPHMGQLILMYQQMLPASNVCVVLVTNDAPLPESVTEQILSLRFESPGLGELQETLRGIVNGVADSFLGGIEIDDEGMRRICYAGAGMTEQQFSAFASLAIVEAGRRGEDKLTVDAVIAGVNAGKTEVVNSSDILELYPMADIDSVGGMENLKDWVRKRARCYGDDAKAFGIEAPKGMVFVGPPGCLSGATPLQYKRGVRNSSRPITMEDLYYKFNGLLKPGAGRGEATPWRDITMPSFLHSIDPDGTVVYNRIVSVIEAGRKEMVKVSFTDGSYLDLTPTHPIAVPGGSYVPAAELTQGIKVLALGSMKPTEGDGVNLQARPPRIIVNTKYHPQGAFKNVDGYTYRRLPKARLVIEAHMNSLDYDEYLHILNHNGRVARTLNYLEQGMEVHHVDENTLNDSPDNLMVYTKQEHAREHGKVENFNVEYFSERTVESVVGMGMGMTYDIQMDMPANNFAANGVFVHNTGKSLAAKAVAGVLGVPLVRFDFGRVFNSLVGASEQRIRQALRMVESMAPCVLFCDEIDKGLGGISNGSGGDSGVSSRVLGSFLTWLQDSTYPVFTMVTANNISGLPPELMRRGRFDAIFSTQMPTDHERREVLRIHVEKRGRKFSSFEAADIQRVVDASNMYVPAEIESAVKDGLIDAFDAEEEFGMEHVRMALVRMVPLSKSFEKEIREMTEWAKLNATPASMTEENKSELIAKSKNRSRVRVRR